MTDQQRAAMQAALEALEDAPYMSNKDDYDRLADVINRLRVALAEQDAEPVAWRWKLFPDGMWHYGDAAPPPPYKSFSLYTHHPRREWVSLTDEEVGTLTVFEGLYDIETPLLAQYIRHIEAKLKEKNHD